MLVAIAAVPATAAVVLRKALLVKPRLSCVSGISLSFLLS
jgi:hypothetical protein